MSLLCHSFSCSPWPSRARGSSITVAPNPVLTHLSRLPLRYPRRSPLRSYGKTANTSLNSASAKVKIISLTFPRNASVNRSGPKRPSIGPKHCVLFPIGVFLLGLTLATSQILFWDTERIRLFYFSTTIGTPPCLILSHWKEHCELLADG